MNISKRHNAQVSAAVLAFGVLATTFTANGAPAVASDYNPVIAHAGRTTAPPDVGSPTEADQNRDVPAIAPDGTPTWSLPLPSAPPAPHPSSVDGSAGEQSWVSVYATADGARIRSRPVDGPVLGTISRGTSFSVSCKRTAHDGYAWGWSHRSGTYGWVRDDLWEEEQFTAPGGGPSPKVPWCA